jgi:hypothetical protein
MAHNKVKKYVRARNKKVDYQKVPIFFKIIGV